MKTDAIAPELGSRGGATRAAAAFTKEQRSASAKAAALARWKKVGNGSPQAYALLFRGIQCEENWSMPTTYRTAEVLAGNGSAAFSEGTIVGDRFAIAGVLLGACLLT